MPNRIISKKYTPKLLKNKDKDNKDKGSFYMHAYTTYYLLLWLSQKIVNDWKLKEHKNVLIGKKSKVLVRYILWEWGSGDTNLWKPKFDPYTLSAMFLNRKMKERKGK